MKRRKWLWIALGVAVVVSIPLVWHRVRDARDAAALDEQLRLARAEGMATTAAEYRAGIPSAKPEENAAPLYRKLPFGKQPNWAKLTYDVNVLGDDASLRAAKEGIALRAEDLRLGDQAAKLPRCWFDRPWEDGYAVLFPELAKMKNLARAFALRGTVAAQEGRPEDALADAGRLFIVANHAGQEPHMIGQLVREAIQVIGMRALGEWSFAHRGEKRYAIALGRAAASMSMPNLKAERRGDLYATLGLVELCATPQGRAKLGLKEDDVAPVEGLMSVLLPPGQAKVAIAKAERAYWAALDAPEAERTAKLKAAYFEVLKGLVAFPTAAKIYTMLGSEEDPAIDRIPRFRARQMQFVALAKALQAGVPKTLDTKSMLSPFDGEPVRYGFDGRQIQIEVSGLNGVLKIPPDPPRS